MEEGGNERRVRTLGQGKKVLVALHLDTHGRRFGGAVLQFQILVATDSHLVLANSIYDGRRKLDKSGKPGREPSPSGAIALQHIRDMVVGIIYADGCIGRFNSLPIVIEFHGFGSLSIPISIPKPQRASAINTVVRQHFAVLQWQVCMAQFLHILWNTHLLKDLGLNIVNGIRPLNVQPNSLFLPSDDDYSNKNLRNIFLYEPGRA
jgi:hypothetical protein